MISLRYLVDSEKIDAAMKGQVAFQDKHFATGRFLLAGQHIPRSGEIIVARGKDRTEVEKMMDQHPLVKRRLASVDIVEFRAIRWRHDFLTFKGKHHS